MKEYEVVAAGVKTTVLLDDEDAKARGLLGGVGSDSDSGSGSVSGSGVESSDAPAAAETSALTNKPRRR